MRLDQPNKRERQREDLLCLDISVNGIAAERYGSDSAGNTFGGRPFCR